MGALGHGKHIRLQMQKRTIIRDQELTNNIEESDLALGDALLVTVKQWGHRQPHLTLAVSLSEELY